MCPPGLLLLEAVTAEPQRAGILTDGTDDLLKTYPAHALNWHDRRTPPSLAEGQASSGRCVVGGIHEKEIATMTPEQAAAQARDAVNALHGRNVMIGPGCVMPINTPDVNVRAVVEAVRG